MNRMFFLLLLIVFVSFSASNFPYSGRVINSNSSYGVKSATVINITTSEICTTDNNGYFGSLSGIISDISVGYYSKMPIVLADNIIYLADKSEEIVSLTVYTLNGKILKKNLFKSKQKGENSIPFDNLFLLRDGVYLLKLSIGDRLYTCKITQLLNRITGHFRLIGQTAVSSNTSFSSTNIERNDTGDSLKIVAKGFYDTTIWAMTENVGVITLLRIPPLGMVFFPSKSDTNGFTYDFWFDISEVTQGSYDMVMSDTIYGYGNNYITPYWNTPEGWSSLHPAYYVNWYDAVLYCNARSKRDSLDTIYAYSGISGIPGSDCILEDIVYDLTKDGYHLPTESEWVYAVNYKLPGKRELWGANNDHDSISKYAWYKGNTLGCASRVCLKEPSKGGLYDIAGNLSEWCNCWYDESNIDRLRRGGSYVSFYNEDENDFGIQERTSSPPDFSHKAFGFRVLVRD